MKPVRIPAGAFWVGGAVLLALLSVLVVSFVSMRRDSRRELCRGNLTLLYIAIRGGDLPDSPRWDTAGTGRFFLAHPEKWPTIQRRDVDLCCPVRDKRDDLDYRGPARPLRQLGMDDPIAADRPGNHGPGQGGNVLLKRGGVFEVAENHELWARAAQTTSD